MMTYSDIQLEAYKRYGNTDMSHWAEIAFICGAEWMVEQLSRRPLDEALESLAGLSTEIKKRRIERRQS